MYLNEEKELIDYIENQQPPSIKNLAREKERYRQLAEAQLTMIINKLLIY